MSDKFTTIPLKELVQIILHQLDTKQSFFGIPNELFFKPEANDSFRSSQYGQLLEAPIGVAAGPHTQLAQNIVAAWLTGARFMELKTVQTLDELEVSKPCIDMQDEGYNCEWSQELKIEQSFDQYLDAWIIIHILKDKLNLGDNSELGMIFNMSVGYDYAGIMNENVQWFFNKMKDASVELKQKIAEIKEVYPNVVNLKIDPQLSDNITLSTMHGCPPEEIEQIGEYLITERKLHTSIKLNPTLLGDKALQKIIEDSGFDTTVPAEAFEHDLKYPDAIKMIARLQQKADENKVFFGLKLTNTLESLNHKEVFPENEKMMYASGRVLHPISINLAKKLQNEFSGKLNISFSGGADSFNVGNIISSGLFPVTVCSDLLKPGGYGKLAQYIENIRSGYSGKTLQKNKENNTSFLNHLNQYAAAVLVDDKYKRIQIQDKSIKTQRALGSFDCVHAPCVDTCPTTQGIPDYMYHTANGDFDKAFSVIQATNPFPDVTGAVCDHVCQSKCTRINYDSTLLIREIKRFVTDNATNTTKKNKVNVVAKEIKVAIIGAGPAGLSAARYLREAGFEVQVYEAKLRPGGMVQGTIPAFRITDTTISNDVERIENLGVKIHYNTPVDKTLFDNLQQNNSYLFIAGGAQKAKDARLVGGDVQGVLDPLDFLHKAKQNPNLDIGSDVIILGGGNTAMDAARTAKRLVGKNGNVTVIYRRTIKQMPADQEEIIALQEEKITIMELVSPVEVISKNNKVQELSCEKMKLGKKDESGRARPIVLANSEFRVTANTIIPAFGQDVVFDFVSIDKLKVHEGSYETQLPNVFVGGDALRGGASIIEAVGDGRKVAEEIIGKANLQVPTYDIDYKKEISNREIKIKKTRIQPSVADYHVADANENNFDLISKTLTKEQAMEEASRCLYCDEICDVCTTVCPNLALYPFDVETVNYQLDKLVIDDDIVTIKYDGVFEVSQKSQILHLSNWCNQCGNCDTFCPTSGAPYKVKPHLHFDYKTFQLAGNPSYYYKSEESNKIYYKADNKLVSLTRDSNFYVYKTDDFEVELDLKSFKIIKYNMKRKIKEVNFKVAVEMSVILQGAEQLINRQEI